MELRPPLHLGVIAIEKGLFGSPSTKVDYIYICMCVCEYMYVYLFFKGMYSRKTTLMKRFLFIAIN